MSGKECNAAHRRSCEHGFALIHAIFFVGLISAVVSLVSGILIAQAQAVQRHSERAQALYAAEAGIAAAVARSAEVGPPPARVRGRCGRGSYDAVVQDDFGSTMRIQSLGACGNRHVRVSVRGRFVGKRFQRLEWKSEQAGPS